MTGQRYQNVILTVIAILLFAHLAIRTGEPAFAQTGINASGPLDVRLVNGEEPIMVTLWSPHTKGKYFKTTKMVPMGSNKFPFHVYDQR